MEREQEYPKLRAVQIVPAATSGGGTALCFQDPLSLHPEMLVLGQEAGFLLQFMDGSRSLREIQAEAVRASGQQLVFLETILELVRLLDSRYLLEGRRFQEALERRRAEFHRQEWREAAHAGQAYPEDSTELRRMLEEILGPAGDLRELRALVAPHLDLRLGASSYRAAYGALARGEPPADLFVLLGTAHAPLEGFFALTSKPFRTPLGIAAVEDGIVEELASRLGEAAVLGGELSHLGEHSLEFQVLFLQHLWGAGGRPLRILPVLCGSLDPLPARAGGEGEAGAPAPVEEFLGALGELLAARKERACLIAGADLAHVGPRYGDPGTPAPVFLARVESADRALLERARERDAAGFLREAYRDGDRFRVCGIPPIYALLRLLGEGGAGEILDYGQARMDPQGSTVSFAALRFRE